MVVAPYWAARVMISTTRQFLVFESGRHSVTRTRSPSLQELASSWACSLVERRRYLPYSACLTWRSTRTVTVLSILLLTTRPSTVLTALVLVSLIALSLASWRTSACSRARSRGGHGDRKSTRLNSSHSSISYA